MRPHKLLLYIYIYILYNITFVPLAIKYVLKIYLIMLRLKMSKYKKYDIKLCSTHAE